MDQVFGVRISPKMMFPPKSKPGLKNETKPGGKKISKHPTKFGTYQEPGDYPGGHAFRDKMEKGLIERQDLGTFGEEEACRFLKKNGCKILDRNYRARGGEIDIVARNGNMILFVEVKTRVSSDFAEPWQNVGFRKRQNIKAASRLYVEERSLRGMDFRFDVISIVIRSAGEPEIEWIQSAF